MVIIFDDVFLCMCACLVVCFSGPPKLVYAQQVFAKWLFQVYIVYLHFSYSRLGTAVCAFWCPGIDCYAQDCGISSALAMEIHQSCTKPSIWLVWARDFCLTRRRNIITSCSNGSMVPIWFDRCVAIPSGLWRCRVTPQDKVPRHSYDNLFA